MRHIRKFNNLLASVERGMTVLLYSGLILLIAFNVISRNIFQESFQKILEISPTLVLWLALVGSSLALKDHRHIKLEILLRFSSDHTRFAANIISSVFGMIVMGVLFCASFEFVRNEIAIFGWQGGFSIIFPWFFCISFFRFFVHLVDPSGFCSNKS